MVKKVSVATVRAAKEQDAPLVMVTAYDFASASICDEAGVDIILVGDSLAMTVLGHSDTLQVTVEQMAYHTLAVAAAKPEALVVADMPWMSYHLSVDETVRNAAKLIRAGAGAVKLEGGAIRAEMIATLSKAEIPVMGHVGLTPQSTNMTGGFKVQGRELNQIEQILLDAKACEQAGCFAIVCEGVPEVVGTKVTEAVDVPVIGIGAGRNTDGQVLVYNDLVGLSNGFRAKFVRTYADSYADQTKAVANFAEDVRSRNYPLEAEIYS